MASQAPTLYCGRCGAPLAPGATFCGRCGTPVQLQAATAPPLYRYPPPPGAAYRPGGQYKMAPALIAGGLLLIVIVAAVGIGGFALSQFVGGSHSACTSNCAPKVVAPLPEEASYRSSAYHFQVNYSSAWTVRSQDAQGLTLARSSAWSPLSERAEGRPTRRCSRLSTPFPRRSFRT